MTQVVDVHLHLFNANFLPLDGVLKKWVSGTWASIAARLLTGRTDRCEASDDFIVTESLADIEETTDPQALLILLVRGLPSEGLQDVMDSYPDAIQDAVSAAFFDQLADRRPRDVFPDRGGFFQWLLLMTWCERRIWSAAQHYYPQVQLFIAHMMDMENYYRPTNPPVYAWPDEQLRRMRRLMDAAQGKLLTFVAFDPRRADWQNVIERGLAAGCAGVKFYPPNGYGPFDAAANRFPDQHTEEFFRYCTAHDLPVFTHCTPVGFEAIKGYGRRFSHPGLWRRALQHFPTLRLCFGHAGGETGWFRPADAANPDFAAEVRRLCHEFPNIYCEVGFMDDILQPAGQHLVQSTLRRELDATLRQKVMYGSDWHMIHQLGEHAQYLNAWETTLSDPSWQDFRQRFFHNNALTWLNLQGHVDRQRALGNSIAPEAMAHWRTLQAIT